MNNLQSKNDTVSCDICNSDSCDYIEAIVYIPDDIGFIDKDVRLVIGHCYACGYNFIDSFDFIEKRRLLTTVTKIVHSKGLNDNNANDR